MESFHHVITQNSKRLSCIEKSFPARLPITNIRQFMVDQEEREWNGPFTFIHMADTQFGLIEKYISKKINPRWDAEIALTRAAIKCINKMCPRPRFVVIGGDMLDAHPDGQEETQLREEQYEDFVQVFQDLDPSIPLVCVCGNHDIGDEPTEASYQIYRRQFGPDFFSFWVGGVKFSVINTQYLKKPSNLPKKFDKQERFIRQMADSKAKHLVVFQHIPFFVSDPDEDDVNYLNIDKDIRFKFMDKMNDVGVKYIFCGHYHRNGGGTYKNFQQVITSALGGPFGADPSGFRVCHVTEHGILHQYIPVIVPSPDGDDDGTLSIPVTTTTSATTTTISPITTSATTIPTMTKSAATITPTFGVLRKESQKKGTIDSPKYPSTPPVTVRFQNLIIETHKSSIKMDKDTTRNNDCFQPPLTDNNNENDSEKLSTCPSSALFLPSEVSSLVSPGKEMMSSDKLNSNFTTLQ